MSKMFLVVFKGGGFLAGIPFTFGQADSSFGCLAADSTFGGAWLYPGCKCLEHQSET